MYRGNDEEQVGMVVRMMNRREARSAFVMTLLFILPSILMLVSFGEVDPSRPNYVGVDGDGQEEQVLSGRTAFTEQPRLGLTQWGGGDGLGVVNCTNLQSFSATEVWMLVYWQGINATGSADGSNWTIVDDMVQDAEDCGVAISVKLKIGKNHWGVVSDASCGSDAGSCYPSDMTAYRQWVGDFVTRYDGRIRAYAIENEATATKFWDDDWWQYLSVLENASQSMRGNDSDVYIVDHGLPSSHLVFGWAYDIAQEQTWDFAFAMVNNWFSQRGIEWFSRQGAPIPENGVDLKLLFQDPTTIALLEEINSTFENQHHTDAMQLHFYESWILMPQLFDWIRGKMMETQGEIIPIEHWEAGFALENHSRYDEQLFGRNATKVLVTSLGEGSGVVHWLPVYTNKPLRCEEETHWGLWETVLDGQCDANNINNVPHHFEARDAADSYLEVATKLSSFDSVTAFSRGPTFWSYQFDGVASQQGGELWANWSEDGQVEWSDETYTSGNIVQSDCGYRRGGAMVTFSIAGDNTTYEVTQWITDDSFIDEAILIRDGQSARIPIFDKVVEGTGCDAQWSWHVDASNTSWADMSIEVCDATPLYIENNKESWITSPGNWCPWSVTGVVSVELRDIVTPRFQFIVSENITYAQGEVYTDSSQTTTTTIPLKLDLYIPQGIDVPSPRPAMLLFHGDNFDDGDKGDANQVAIAREFVTRGYVVACANYRLQSDDPVASGNSPTQRAMNAAVRDGRDAILWLGGNMSTLDIDLNRVSVGGDSAGAYIATHLAYENELGVSDGIAGVFDLWGGLGEGNSNMMYDKEAFIFIVHGDDDPYVPLQWSEDLVARAEQYTIPYEYHHLAGRGHGFPEIDLWNDTVEGSSLMDRAIAFFAANLYQFGYGPSDMVNPVSVNASDVIGRIAPIHGVNEGPVINMSYGINSDDPWRKACDLGHFTNANYTEPQQEANVPEGRWHPWGVSDMNRIWKPWPAFDGHDPTNASNYDFRALDATFLAADAAGINISWRAGHSKISEVDPNCGQGFNTPPENFTLWSQVVVQILKHYKSGWADGYHLDTVKNVEIWIEPYLQQWWNGTDWEYYSLYAHANAAISAEFGETIPVIASLQSNTNFTRNFLRNAQADNTPIDAIDLHPYRIRPSKIDEMVWQDVDPNDDENNSLEHMLIEFGYPRDTPIYFTEWHRSIGEYALSPGSQSFMTSSLIEMNDLWSGNGEHGLEMAHSFMSMHFFWDEETNAKKPLGWTWYVYGKWMIEDTPNRLATTGSHWTSEPEPWIGQDLNILAGRSDDSKQVNVMISSYDNTDAAETGTGHPDNFSEYPTTIDLEVTDLPWGENCSYSWERWTYRTLGLIKVGYGVGEGGTFTPPVHQMNSRSYEVFKFFLTDDDPACSETISPPVDEDGDGVADENDLCPNTPLGGLVNSDGCAESQLDDDGDGVMNDADQCSNTPTGAVVNSVGCADSQLDDDGDGVMNDADQCPDTPVGAIVGADGCEIDNTPPDSDGDGIPDDDDLCPDTSVAALVDENGCSRAQLDGDGDGVTDDIDNCPDTPTGSAVDAVGCAIETGDLDSDGVPDRIDECPDSLPGVKVGSNGCAIVSGGNGGIWTNGLSILLLLFIVLLIVVGIAYVARTRS